MEKGALCVGCGISGLVIIVIKRRLVGSDDLNMIVVAHQPNFLPWLGFFDNMQRFKHAIS